jgi:phage gp36-like protein
MAGLEEVFVVPFQGAVSSVLCVPCCKDATYLSCHSWIEDDSNATADRIAQSNECR